MAVMSFPEMEYDEVNSDPSKFVCRMLKVFVNSNVLRESKIQEHVL